MIVEKPDDETKAERPKVKPMLKTKAVKQKKGLMGRMFKSVAGPDALNKIGDYITRDIIIPAIKNIIADSITSGINMALFGDSKPIRSGQTGGRYTEPKHDYSKVSRAVVRDTINSSVKTNKYAEDYLIPDRLDALQVLQALVDYAERYDSVSVADYYDMLDVKAPYTLNNYGWMYATIASEARVVPVRGGYVINFPPLEVIS